MEELYLLFRLIAFCLKSSLVEKLGDEPPSTRDQLILEEHSTWASIEELAQYIHDDDRYSRREDAFMVLYAEMMRRTEREISPDVTGRINYPYPTVRNFLTLAAGELEDENDPLAALQAIREALDTQRQLQDRVDEIGCAHGCGAASAAHVEYMRGDAR